MIRSVDRPSNPTVAALNCVLAGALSLAASLAAAQPSGPDADTKITVEAAWEIAIAEQRVALTCSAVLDKYEDRGSTYLVVNAWNTDRAAAFELMTTAGWPAEELADLDRRSAPEAVRLPDDTPFGEVLALCHGTPGWFRAYSTQNYTRIGPRVEQALKNLP